MCGHIFISHLPTWLVNFIPDLLGLRLVMQVVMMKLERFVVVAFTFEPLFSKLIGIEGVVEVVVDFGIEITLYLVWLRLNQLGLLILLFY
jgi:hypothetical protein